MGDAITIESRAFLLRPRTTRREREKFVQYTQSWLRPAEMEPAAVFATWSSNAPAPSGSVPAHVASKAMISWAPELAATFDRALLTAYFSDNRNISDPLVQADIARECGTDRSAFADHMASNVDILTRQVLDEHNEAIEQGITAVPTVVIDGVFPIPGAQEVDLYEHWIRRIIERRADN